MSDPKPGNCSDDAQEMQEIFEVLAGPWLFGVSLDILLFGVLTVQIYVYYLAFPEDRRLLKLAVIWVYLVGVAQTILAIVDLNTILVNLAQVAQLLSCPGLDSSITTSLINNLNLVSPVVHFWLTAIAFSEAALTTQWLYAYRIYVISRKLWIVLLIIWLSLGQLGTSVVGCICLSTIVSPFLAPLGEIMTPGGGLQFCAVGFGWVWGPLNFLCDITITVSMSILLLKRRTGTLKKTTHAHISRIIRIVVETGLATSIVVVVNTLTYNLPYLFITPLASLTAWFVPGLIMGKVYSNSMLALLNSRLTIVGGRNTGDPFDNSEIRSEVLRTEVGGDRVTSPITRRRTTNGETPVST